MFTKNNVIYQYDGSYDGLLCCVFESFLHKELPDKIITADFEQTLLMPCKTIETDSQKTQRVANWIKTKFTPQFNSFLNMSFITNLEDKETYILRFLVMAKKYGNHAITMIADPTVNTLMKAVKYLKNESHRYKQFIRFTDYSGVLACEIHPNSYVLPMIRQHFCQRYPNEVFMIYDSSHSMALAYKPYKSAIIPVSELSFNNPSPEDTKYQDLWKTYYNTIAIEGRYNPKCRMNHMPKRYWKYMTEFQDNKFQLFN